MHIQTFQGGYDHNFFYILSSQNQAAVIDCFDATIALNYSAQNQLNIKYIISTHNHFDHTEANYELQKKTDAKIVMYKSNQCDLPVNDQDNLSLGTSLLKILYTPGHTADSICILADNQSLFTGDTLFVGCIGGQFYADSQITQPQSLQKLIQLPDHIVIYPGHNYGKTPTSTIQTEKNTNPYLQKILN